MMTLTVNEVDVRAERMLHDEQVRADGMLSKLLLAHVPFGIGLAALHGYWVLGIVASLVLALTPLAVVRVRPGTLVSRCTIAAAFAGYSALFIQETHGMTELHFHIFAWLAFMRSTATGARPRSAGSSSPSTTWPSTSSRPPVPASGFSPPRGRMPTASRWSRCTPGSSSSRSAVLIYISIALARETYGQAELLVTQRARPRHDAGSRPGPAGPRPLHRRTPSAPTRRPAPRSAPCAAGIGFVAELVQSIDRTAGNVASSSVEMAQTTAEAGPRQLRGRRVPDPARRGRPAPGARRRRRPRVRRAGRRGRRLQRRERPSHRRRRPARP